MAQWTKLLFFFYGVLHGQETQRPTVQECCQDGTDRALGGQDCTILPLISSSHTCRIAQEQCCAATVGDKLCDNGIKMAQGQGACERPFFQGDPWETQLSKMCCDCCVLGLTLASWGSSCELQGLLLGRQCAYTAKTCCGKNTTEEIKPIDEDVNECLIGTHNCVSGQVCINTEGSFRCQRESGCGTGYELTDNNTCQDIDECTLGTHNCGAVFSCNNTAGSFRCHPKQACAEGFIQDAIGSCIDINECVAHPTPCLPGRTCVNTMGSYTCRRNTVTCGRGYHLTEDGTRCEDINECRHYPLRLCAHKCENTEGSYQCSCSTGFKLSHDGRSCEDINECDANPCSQECANVYGSFHCYCRRGYQLSDIDGITCEDIDECALPHGGHVCSYGCSNAPGSFYCTCPPTGYTLALNGRTCQDLDECAAGSHTCSVSESCFNIQGGFRCLPSTCPSNFRPLAQGSRRGASVSVRCIKTCHPKDTNCILDPLQLITHIGISLPTFRDLSEPEEIVVLRTVVATHPVSLSGPTDVFFYIRAADDQSSFDVQKRSHQGLIMGVVRQVKPIVGPRDLVLEVAMDYLKSMVVSHRNVVTIHVFISGSSGS